MKLLFASDIHGSIDAARAVLAAFEREGASRLVLLGDVLYHGPRNDLPAAYAPKEVISLLNGVADRIFAVRGNCDTEVDQMVLSFPVLAEYAVLPLEKGVAYLTHGHKPLPPLMPDDIVISGHTHLTGISTTSSGHINLNPGSVSIPKGGTSPAYMIYENGVFSIRHLDSGEEIDRYVVSE
jgi:putative phosphoesterase